MAEGGASQSTYKDRLRNSMLFRLVRTDAHFKHQQIGEPDLTFDEKSNIALDILKKSPALFLERFSRYLTLDDVNYFEDLRGEYHIAFYLEEISKRYADTGHNIVKNRRYQALQELMGGGEYFSDDEMKWRDPLLFEQMIGKYETESETSERGEKELDRSDLRFSTILLKHMDTQANKQFYEVMKEREEEQEEEEEETDEEEEGGRNDTMGERQSKQEIPRGREEEDENEMERKYLRNEFLQIMQERFLSGEDGNFDYSKVDGNPDYDSLDIAGHDAEEKYFDADDAVSSNGDNVSREGDCGQMYDKQIRRKMEVMDLKAEEGREYNLEGQKTQTDDMDIDYMSYIPSEELIRKSRGEDS